MTSGQVPKIAESRRAFAEPRPAVFFDRDGTINADSGYTYRLDDLRFLPGAIAAVKRVNSHGWYAFLVTNQSGVARGLFAEPDVQAFHAHMQDRLRAAGAHFDDIRYCPHHPEGSVEVYARACDCRKPKAGMILDLMNSWPVVHQNSFVVGNSDSDMRAAQAAGLRAVRYQGGDLDALLATHLPKM